MLSYCSPRIPERKISEIVENLTEKIYLHGHGIDRKEADDIGLRVKEPEEKVEKLIWDLYLNFEDSLKLNTTKDKKSYIGEDKYTEEDCVIACIESRLLTHHFSGDLVMKKVYKEPEKLNLNLRTPIQFPPDIEPQEVPPEVRKKLNKLAENKKREIIKVVNKQIESQLGVKRIKTDLVGGSWERVKVEE